MSKPCPICNGELGLLGRLGDRNHYLCRHCGMQVSRKVKPRAKKVDPQPGLAFNDTENMECLGHSS